MILISILLILAILFGIAYCFFGYAYFRRMLAVFGFIVGSFTAYMLLSPVLSSTVAIIASLVIGIIAGALAFTLYVVSLFLTGVSLGYTLSSLVLASFAAVSPGISIVITVILCLVGGILAVLFKRVLIIIATSFLGAAVSVTGVAMLIKSFPVMKEATTEAFYGALNAAYASYSSWMIPAILALAVIGMLVQFLKKNKK